MSGATLATLLIASMATVETAFGSGPFAHQTPFPNAVLLDLFLAVLSVSGMTLAAVIAERGQAQREREHLVREQAAMEARLRFATIIESSDDAIIGTDMSGLITDQTGCGTAIRIRGGENDGKPFTSSCPPIAASIAPDHGRSKAGRPGQTYETASQQKEWHTR